MQRRGACLLIVLSLSSARSLIVPPAKMVPLTELLSTCVSTLGSEPEPLLKPADECEFDSKFSQVDACSRGCTEIRNVQAKRSAADGRLKVALKDEEDARSALTEADIAAQKAIVDALKNEWPGLKIIGEEDESEDPRAASSASELPLLRRNLCPDAASALAVPLTAITIFVDPLDGTREFVEGRLSNVQSLVGISVRGRAVAGAIGLPFPSGALEPSSAEAAVVYGLVGAGTGTFGRRSTLNPTAADAARPVVTTGDSSNRILVAATSTALASGGSHDVMGGAGAKMLKVAEGSADLSIMHFGTSYWDTASGCSPAAPALQLPLSTVPSPVSRSLARSLSRSLSRPLARSLARSRPLSSLSSRLASCAVRTRRYPRCPRRARHRPLRCPPRPHRRPTLRESQKWSGRHSFSKNRIQAAREALCGDARGAHRPRPAAAIPVLRGRQRCRGRRQEATRGATHTSGCGRCTLFGRLSAPCFSAKRSALPRAATGKVHGAGE